jgi:hypothetical protein
MPPKYLLFHVWHKGKIFFTPGFIQLVARRQYKTLIPISRTKTVMKTLS